MLGLYALLVAFGAVTGVLFTTVVEHPRPPTLFFLLSLPPTPLGFAVYGAVTVAVVLGVPLAGVVYASRSIEGPTVEGGSGEREGGDARE